MHGPHLAFLDRETRLCMNYQELNAIAGRGSTTWELAYLGALQHRSTWYSAEMPAGYRVSRERQ